MCGIAGFLGDFNPQLLARFNRAMAHRGPDGEGVWHHAPSKIGFAHRRLAIIDPTDHGAQPMASCGGRYQILFNGEIYNFKKLQDEINSEYQYNINSDTAIIGPLYDQFGAGMLNKLEGMFSIAIWDREKQELFLARDHAGIKPVYYTEDKNGFLFSSEIKTLLQYDEINKELDFNALQDYVQFLWSAGEHTPFKHIRKLLPGHYIKLKQGEKAAAVCWYQLPLTKKYDYVKSKDDLRNIFAKSVEDHCLSDVKIGAFLSGGIDSSAIVAHMCQAGFAPEKAYCIAFAGANMADEGFSEDIDYAQMLAKQYDVDLQEVQVNADCLRDLPQMIWQLEEPQADPSPLYVHAIGQAARADGIKVLLSGTGGDDVFSGYRRHQAAMLRHHVGAMAPVVGSICRGISHIANPAMTRRLKKLAKSFSGSENDFLLDVYKYTPDKWIDSIFLDSISDQCEEKYQNAIKSSLRASDGFHPLKRLLFMEMHGFLPDHNLNYTDKAAMAAGVEVRVPFLDLRIINFAYDLPPNKMVHCGEAKWLLKQAVAQDIPAEILSRSKAGFGAPIRKWLTGDAKDLVHEYVLGERAMQRGLWNKAGVEKLILETEQGKTDGAYTILALMVTEIWLRTFCDQTDIQPIS